MRTPEEARARNAVKWRLMGGAINYTANPKLLLTPEEEEELRNIKQRMAALVTKWDDRSARLGFNIKPHVCSLCHKRSDKQYLYLDQNYGVINLCRKHYKQANDRIV